MMRQLLIMVLGVALAIAPCATANAVQSQLAQMSVHHASDHDHGEHVTGDVDVVTNGRELRGTVGHDTAGHCGHSDCDMDCQTWLSVSSSAMDARVGIITSRAIIAVNDLLIAHATSVDGRQMCEAPISLAAAVQNLCVLLQTARLRI